MYSIYYYAIALLIIGLIAQQLFYINKKYNQQNIKIIEYYLHLKLIDKILKYFSASPHNFQEEKIQDLIKNYYQIDDIFIYQTDYKKFGLENYKIASLNLMNKKIDNLRTLLFELSHEKLYKLDEVNNIYGIFYPNKKIMTFFIKNSDSKTEDSQFTKIESHLLESIIFPLMLIKN